MQKKRLRATWPFQALGDDTRFRVIRLLANSAASVGPTVLARTLEIAPSHLSRHLKILQDVGLTAVEQRGRLRFVSLRGADRQHALLLATVCSTDDETGVFARDAARLMSAVGLAVVSRRRRASDVWPGEGTCAHAVAQMTGRQEKHVSSGAGIADWQSPDAGD
jgi:DNA-binding transcriptional ArsR family regulator